MIEMFITTYATVYMMYLHYYTNPKDCQNVFILWQCALLRWPVGLLIPFMSFIHAAIFVERFIASRYQHDYEKFGNTLGCWLSSITVCLMLHSS